MNRNQLKIIACISMFIDHAGYLLFPQISAFHHIGRIAMPIFAFFIAEGCLYTRNIKKYFLRVFFFGMICQSVYIIEGILTKSSGGGYLNILLTFSVSILLCSTFLKAKESVKNKTDPHNIFTFLLCLLSVIAADNLCKKSFALIGVGVEFDYGIYGIVLPFFAVISKNRNIRLILFSLAQTLFAFTYYKSIGLALCSLIPLILLMFYNGQSGKRNLKYFFYAFYPCHLVLIYLFDFII